MNLKIFEITTSNTCYSQYCSHPFAPQITYRRKLTKRHSRNKPDILSSELVGTSHHNRSYDGHEPEALSIRPVTLDTQNQQDLRDKGTHHVTPSILIETVDLPYQEGATGKGGNTDDSKGVILSEEAESLV